ncbi:oxidoreductase [Chitinophaga arvensicola]|uniref:Short-chain dehydrogenase n=1 Tax=Chitinophaga arvensicola TaxID=29529 RepID=A0A1I0S9D3_9BACT|nr:oxidoreductase [Chitinophaga arvensicola]SEW52701.1 Short-chain dehydrogenase [Chitinophaga arvensicola]
MKNQKVWFITGASRGFGLDITKAALAAGDKVVATVRSKPEQLKAALQHSDALLVVTLDVTNEAQVKTGVQEAIAHFGRIDVLVNNAGYGLVGATEEVSDQEVRKQFDTNVFGLLNVTRAVLPQMRAQQSGHIINISSLFGYGAGAPGLGLYGATKFAVEGISEGLALEVKPLGIHVTALAPGIFRTEFASADSYQPAANVLEAYAATSGQTRKGINQLHGNQPGDPAKLAQVVLRLADSEHPPLHVPVGRDAIALVRAKAAATAQEIDAWEEVSGNTDFTQA